MLSILRTTSNNSDFQSLTALFDEYLIDIDGDEKEFFAHYNQIYLENAIVCYENTIPVGCGAFKNHADKKAEIKRMFVHPDHRGKAIATNILSELEAWATELLHSEAILETSVKLDDAIALYTKSGYEISEQYGQYIGVESSLCMKKKLKLKK